MLVYNAFLGLWLRSCFLFFFSVPVMLWFLVEPERKDLMAAFEMQWTIFHCSHCNKSRCAEFNELGNFIHCAHAQNCTNFFFFDTIIGWLVCTGTVFGKMTICYSFLSPRKRCALRTRLRSSGYIKLMFHNFTHRLCRMCSFYMMLYWIWYAIIMKKRVLLHSYGTFSNMHTRIHIHSFIKSIHRGHLQMSIIFKYAALCWTDCQQTTDVAYSQPLTPSFIRLFYAKAPTLITHTNNLLVSLTPERFIKSTHVYRLCIRQTKWNGYFPGLRVRVHNRFAYKISSQKFACENCWF